MAESPLDNPHSTDVTTSILPVLFKQIPKEPQDLADRIFNLASTFRERLLESSYSIFFFLCLSNALTRPIGSCKKLDNYILIIREELEDQIKEDLLDGSNLSSSASRIPLLRKCGEIANKIVLLEHVLSTIEPHMRTPSMPSMRELAAASAPSLP